ncbi:MAG: hypothetical protein FJ154_07480 [Gammaproteobacteria bacterium]|jgi:flagellar biosynthesis chaperone FliJ|nr:hypothetical protein [Gammaproteobacteria bacterium]
MSTRQRIRASRLQRIARVTDALAKSAEMVATERRQALASEQERLETVERYCGDYGDMIVEGEKAGRTVGSLRLYRDFSGWLSTLSVDQKNKVAQAEFLFEAALEEAQGSRKFADAIDHAADKSRQVAVRETALRDQQILDGLFQARPMVRLASGLQRK